MFFYLFKIPSFLSVFALGSQVMPTSMPPPRKLPQRPWAASIPTILSHNALHVLLLPSPTPCMVPGLAGSYLCSPLERFLGSVIMRRHLQRIIQQEATVSVSSVIGCLLLALNVSVFIVIACRVASASVIDRELQRARRDHVQDGCSQVPSGSQSKELSDSATQSYPRKRRALVPGGASGAGEILWDPGKWKRQSTPKMAHLHFVLS